MTLFMCASLAAAAVVQLWAAPRPAGTAEELAAAGWSPGRLAAAKWAAAVSGTLLLGGVLFVLAGGRTALMAAAAIGVWLPRAAAPLVRSMILGSYRPRRDRALLLWLQRVRLHTATGVPVGRAVVEAAEQVSDRGFAGVASNIDAALKAGTDPLEAAARSVAGSAAETLLGTVTTVERTGAASGKLIDQIVDRAISTLNARRSAQVESRARTMGSVITLISLVSSMVIIASVAFNLLGGAA